MAMLKRFIVLHIFMVLWLRFNVITMRTKNHIMHLRFFVPFLSMIISCTAVFAQFQSIEGSALQRVQFNNPGATSYLGVGLWSWPLPMDYDNDGDYDLVVSCNDKPFNGTFVFVNPDGNTKFPVFLPPKKIGPGMKNALVSYVGEDPVVLVSNMAYPDFRSTGFEQGQKVYPEETIHKGKGNARFNLWRYVDFNGDGAIDIAVGPDDWGDYGWDDAFNDRGEWTRGPLHGYVYIMINEGSTADPRYKEPYALMAGGDTVDVFGAPFPNFGDFDMDGDLDLLCGEFLDGFTYFENKGTRTAPVYAAGRRLKVKGKPLVMDLQMITPTSIDWDRDGDLDIVCGDEDGRVALIEHTGKVVDGMPVFKQPVYFRQQAENLKFGALVTPFSVDWDNDGDEDLICGNTAGYIGFIENLDGGFPPRWANPVYLKAEGEPIRIQAGKSGSIQGPAEAKWGYTTLSVADWNHDGLLDIVVNSIWGKVLWIENIGSPRKPKLAPPKPVKVAWTSSVPKPAWNWWDPGPMALAAQWRTTPYAVDWNEDGLTDLVMLDHEGYLAFFERFKKGDELLLSPGKRIFAGTDRNRDGEPIDEHNTLLRMTDRTAGGSGRRKFCIVDWDGDGRLDLITNSVTANLLRNTGTRNGITTFEFDRTFDMHRLAGHTTSPTTVDWDKNGIPDLLIGAEDGHFYYLQHR
jgi:hypothetical protein